MRWFPLLIICVAATVHGQQIPRDLQGTWVISRILPTRTISCWGDVEGKSILGTRIEYSEHLFRWKNKSIKNPAIEVRTLTAEQFHDEYSGGGANDSQVTFEQLRIHTKQVQQVTIKHPFIGFTEATSEIPGDSVLLKNRNTIIFSVCNLYFEAFRMSHARH
jgi:hypothetical protein